MNTLLLTIQDSLLFFWSVNLMNLSATATASTSFIVIFVAEMGDKSQLVCMTLAARHRALPVVLGAIIAFILLNSLAVIFGSTIANWLPEYLVSATVALLFFVFGLHALRVKTEDKEEVIEKSGHSLFFTTFILITLAEFGDKTQLAVVALSSTTTPIAVWIGASCALILTSTLGVIAGRTVLQKFPMILIHKLSGVIFIILAILAAYNTYLNFDLSLLN